MAKDQQAGRRATVYWQVFCGWITNSVFLVQGLFLIPLYIHFLGDRLYGFWLASGGILSWLTMFDFGVAVITNQRCSVALAESDYPRLVQYFWHGVLAFAVVAGFFLLLLSVIATNLASWLAIDSEYYELVPQCFVLASISTLLFLAHSYLKAVASALQQSKVPMITETLGTILSLVVIVLSLVVFEQGLWSLAYGMFVRSAIPLFVNAFYVTSCVRFYGKGPAWSRAVAMDYLKNTPSVFIAKVSSGFANGLAPILITRMISPEATVIYSITMRVLQILQGFSNRFIGALVGALSHLYADTKTQLAKKQDLMARIVTMFGVGVGGSFILYCLLNGNFISLWVGSEFFAGQAFTGLAAMAVFLLMRNNLLVAIGVAVGSIRSVQNTQTFEQWVKALGVALGVYAYGLNGALLAYIIAGLLAQLIYRRILMEGCREIYESMQMLMWMWLPLAAVILLVHPLANLISTQSWVIFLVISAVASVPFGVLVVSVIPELKIKLRSLLGRFALSA